MATAAARRGTNSMLALLVVLTLGNGIVGFDRQTVAYLAPFIVKDLGLTNAQVGLTAAVRLTRTFSFCSKSNRLKCFAETHRGGNGGSHFFPNYQILKSPACFAQNAKNLLGIFLTLHKINSSAIGRYLKNP